MEMNTTKLFFFAKLSKWTSQTNESTLGARPGKTNTREKAKGKGKGRNTAATAALTDKISSEIENTQKKEKKSKNSFKKKNKENKSSSSEMEEVKTPSPSPVRDNQGKQQGTPKPYWNPRWSLNRWHTSAKMWNGWQTKSWRPRTPFWPRGSKGDSGVGWKGKGHGGKGRNVH